jgi:hypothetical protein
MRTFKYRWKAKGNEFVGTRDAEDRDHLQALISQTGGELVEVLEETNAEKVKESGSGLLSTKKCPLCAEVILVDAIKCKHCGEMLDIKNRAKLGKGKAVTGNKKGFIECPFCHQIVRPGGKQATLGTFLVTLALLCLWVLPGIIYMIWMSVGKQCPECKMGL